MTSDIRIADNIKLPYGLQGDRLKHISEVERGLACNCTCPACQHRLIARQGAVVQHHFAHQGEACRYGLETILHMAAKQVLADKRMIVLPSLPNLTNPQYGVIVSFGPRSLAAISVEIPEQPPPRVYTLDDVQLEKSMGSIRPDLIVHIQGKPLLIEITVTHGVDGLKLARIRSLGIGALEINLSKQPRDITPEILERAVITSVENKRWLYNPKAEQQLRERQHRSTKRIVKRRGRALHVALCPIRARVYKGQSYANVVHDCAGCPHLVEWGVESKTYEASNPALSDEQRMKLLNHPEPEGYILCDGVQRTAGWYGHPRATV